MRPGHFENQLDISPLRGEAPSATTATNIQPLRGCSPNCVGGIALEYLCVIDLERDCYGKKDQRRVRPQHPGAILRSMLEELAIDGGGHSRSLTQTELAKRLGVSRRAVNDLIHERRNMTAVMAIRLSRVFGTTPDIWLNLQKAVDLWDASRANKNKYAKLKPIAA